MALSDVEADERTRIWVRNALIIVLFLVALIPLLLTPVAPLIDFYNHLARFYVLSHIDGSSFLRAQYTAHWTLLPNIGVDLLGTALLSFLPPLIAGHVIIGILMALQYGGVLYFHRQLTGRTSLLVALLLIPFLYSYVLNWGFANFLLGQGLAFWSVGWWLAHRDRPGLAVPVSCILALLIFFSHGMAFFMYGIMLLALEIGYSFEERPRNRARIIRRLIILSIQAVLPVGLFLLWQSGAATGAAVDAASKTTEPFFSRMEQGFLHHIDPVIRVAEGPAFWFDAITLIAMAALTTVLIWSGRITIARTARPLVQMQGEPYRQGIFMLIRAERPADIDAIHDLTVRAFAGMPYSQGTEAPIVRLLRQSGDLTVSLVAEEDGIVIGHVAFSPVRIGNASANWFGLGPISVEPARQRSGIGKVLIKSGLEILRSQGAAGVALIGDPLVYRSSGFISDGRLTYKGLETRYVQRFLFSGPDPEGELHFADAFDQATRPE